MFYGGRKHPTKNFFHFLILEPNPQRLTAGEFTWQFGELEE